MPKPTLLQSLLNQPTQSYLNVHASAQQLSGKIGDRKGYYHSVRDDMVRVAEAARQYIPPSPPQTSHSPPLLPLPSASLTPPRPQRQQSGDSDNNFFTPSGSPCDHSFVGESDSLKRTSAMGAPQPALLSPAMDSSRAKQDIVNDADTNNGNDSTASGNDEVNSADLHLASTQEEVSVPRTSPEDATSTSEASSPTSLSAPSTPTRATSPATSENGHEGTGATRNASTRSNSLRRKKAENRRSMTTYTDDDWAKDVRWLVPPNKTSASDIRKTWHSTPPKASTTSTPASVVLKQRSARPHFDLDFASSVSMLSNAPLQIQVRASHRRTASQSTANSHRPTGRRRMSAVWEEDEGDETAPTSPRRVHTDPTSLASLNRSRSLSSQHRPPERARSPTSMASGESGSIGTSAASSTPTSASRTVDLPNPLPVTDGGTPSGFTSLVLPRAAYTPRNKRYSMRFGNSSHVDITRTGLAQTTMSTVSITKNAASSALGSLRPRFLSLTSLSGSDSAKTKVPKTPSHLLGTLPRPLRITSHTPPPSKVHSHQVLVQVYAVALDGLDDRIVSEKAARKDCYGFIPGRAIVGRAVEVGFELNNVSKGDWVIGLLDARKCGALAEFVIVEKRRIARCPRPSPGLTLEQLALLPLCGVPAHRAVRSAGVDTDTERDSLSGRALVLQGHDGAGALAVQALAYAGMHVTAHIPLHADPPRTRTPSTSSTSSSEPSDEKSSVESASEQFSTREAEERVRKWGARGVRVGDALEVVENCDKASFDVIIDTVGGKRIWAACHRALAISGQFTTLIGDAPLSPSPSPPSSAYPSPSATSHSGFSFRHHHSQSDSTGHAVPSIHAHVRANFRAMRHALKPRRAIGYALISPAADVDQCGEDVRDSLAEAVRRATMGVFVPFVGGRVGGDTSEKEKEAGIQMSLDAERGRNKRIVTFEHAPELFGSGALSEGRTGVVRVVD